jgi:hypothetical protein
VFEARLGNHLIYYFFAIVNPRNQKSVV